MSLRIGVLAVSFFTLTACDTALFGSGSNGPADNALMVADAALGVRACAASLSGGGSLSALESQGFTSTSVGGFRAGPALLPVNVRMTDQFSCRTVYPNNADGLPGAVDLVTQALGQDGYTQEGQTSSNGDAIVSFVKSGQNVFASVGFGTESNSSGLITIELTN